jgi:SAM-dependent methyltransferase
MKYKINNLSSRIGLDDGHVSSHIDFLKEKFYQIDTKWPQFKVLFDSLEDLAKTIPVGKTVLILERAYFYGGWTLFAPIFHKQKIVSVDCVIDGQDGRWGEQESWLKDDRCIKWRPDFINGISNLVDIKSESIDYIIVPNVVHHEKNQDKMFQEFERVLKKSGKCLVFEGLVRELHHMPDDYVRYTHEGLKIMLEKNGLKFDTYKFGSGVFDVIAYVWQNAFEYLPKDLRKEKIKWFYSEHFPYLQSMDQKYKENLVKPDKAFPMSYIVWASKI